MRAVKKIVLITTTQPAANPRIVKEADVLAAEGYNVIMLYCFTTGWAQEKDKSILDEAVWDYKQIGGENKSSFSYSISRILFAIYKFINKKSGGAYFAEKAHARCYSSLLKEAIKLKADWYIGHNPGTMAIAANAAKINNAKCGFDFEDYHRGEYNNENKTGYLRQIFLEKKYIDEFIYISTASPLITKAIEADFANKKLQFITLLNTFFKKDQPDFRSDLEENQLKLFWFSQYIGTGRGLELLITCLQKLNDTSITLTLAGNCTNLVKNQFLKLAGDFSNNIDFCGVITPKELPRLAARFHVGLALEPARDINNDIALSNKIFTFLLAGNAIIFSETNAQKKFNYEYKAGISFPIGDREELEKCILYFKNKLILNNQRVRNFTTAHEVLNWENESKKLLAIIN